jgi:hypothetical protein
MMTRSAAAGMGAGSLSHVYPTGYARSGWGCLDLELTATAQNVVWASD